MSLFNCGWVKQFIPNKEKVVIFDVGAHNFHDSINFKKSVPNSDVYSFEAYNFNIEKYGETAKSSGVKVFNLAVSNEDGEITFYNSTNLNGTEWTCSGSILKPTKEEGVTIHPGLNYNKDGLKVKSVRLDSFCKENNIEEIDVIHMDIQGAEYYGIKGLGDSLRPKLIFCETCEYDSYEDSLTQKDLDDLLESMGYEMYVRLEYDTLYVYKG